jgi:small subunit ribosomal protein S18
VAKQRKRPARTRRDRKDGPTSGRRKPCPYCREKIDQVDYKDVSALRRFISERGKIRSRRITGACRTSPRARTSAGNAASGPVVARAETGSGPQRTATREPDAPRSRGTHGLGTSRNSNIAGIGI